MSKFKRGEVDIYLLLVALAIDCIFTDHTNKTEDILFFMCLGIFRIALNTLPDKE